MDGSIAGLDLTGKHLVVKKDIHLPEFQAISQRVFLARGGFGCRAGAIGNAVFGTYVVDGEQCRRERRDFERLATPEEVEAAAKGTK